jgi:GNAT superfamily N-acetyltransferase
MPEPSFDAQRTTLDRVGPLRALFLVEHAAQVRYDACHARGWTDEYLLTADGRVVGYGSIKGQEIPDRDTVFELYVVPPFRRHARALFRALLDRSGATWVECQTNDRVLTGLLHEFTEGATTDTVLYEAYTVGEHVVPGATFRAKKRGDVTFEHHAEPDGDFVVVLDGRVVATGGFLLHYNPPFADLYMEVDAAYRRRGVGTFLVQGLIRECWLAGRIPAARTSTDNFASQRTLAKAGLRVAGHVVRGRVRGRM